jgi:dihydropteroate synthase
MPIRRYLRPLGVMPPSLLGEGAILIAGRTDLAAVAFELVERDGVSVHKQLVTAPEILSGRFGHVKELLENLRRPREPIAGLVFDRPRIMGIVNVTPDSFSDGGRYLGHEAAVAHALQLEVEGADILDIGGESTRPRAEPVDLEEEWRRVGPVIEALVPRTRARVSVDTRKAEIMRRAAGAGVHLINDVSALSNDPASLRTAAETGLPVVLMHALGDPRTMQDKPAYADVVLDVCDALEARIEACEAAGIPRTRLIVDPGIGFGKTLSHNLALLGSLSLFHGLGCPVMLGASRKSFIGHLTGAADADRLAGSLAAALTGASQGVQILRVHDVAATRQALAVWEGAGRAGTAPG